VGQDMHAGRERRETHRWSEWGRKGLRMAPCGGQEYVRVSVEKGRKV